MSPEQAGISVAGRRHPQRHLLAGRAPLRALDGNDADREQRLREPPMTEVQRLIRRRSRRGRARGCRRRDDGRRAPAVGPPIGRAPHPAGARRPRLDRHEVPGEGPGPPLRDGQRAWHETSSDTCEASRSRPRRRRGVSAREVRRASTGSLMRRGRGGCLLLVPAGAGVSTWQATAGPRSRTPGAPGAGRRGRAAPAGETVGGAGQRRAQVLPGQGALGRPAQGSGGRAAAATRRSARRSTVPSPRSPRRSPASPSWRRRSETPSA